ncbi:Cytochrome P450 93A1 [Acorus calamus]|uniref:Cytochrome P450 93A1 n=1 Tax=Acorus calamus TaxID=4465 RepID=A0AAV9BZR8_ACOCL|nr:Cytochrome P450 93A1 [Acorus calamus]
MSDPQTYFIPFLLCLLPTLYLLRRLLLPNHPSPLPPGPWALPILGHLHLLGPIPHQSLHRLSARHGPLFSLRLGSVPCVVASSPSTARQLLKNHDLTFSSRPVSSAVQHLSYGGDDFSFAPHGPYWKFIKKFCMSDLLGPRTLDAHRPLRRDELLRFLRSLSSEVDVGRALKTMTNNVVTRMLMGRRCSETEEETEEILGLFDLGDYVWFLKGWDLHGFKKRLDEVHRKFDGLMEGILKEKEETDGRDAAEKDLLDLLLDIAKDGEAEIRLSRENIKAFALDIFAAGTDTSAVTIQWALAELINHPDIMRAAQEEILSVVGRARLVDETDVPGLPYIQAIVKETLRLHTTAPMTVRVSSEDCHVDGYHIPAGTQAFINIWAIHRDPTYWPDPLEFRPERFVGSAVDVKGQQFELLPFGSGRRGCPGMSLAMHVVQTTLAAMVQCFEWRVVGQEGKVDMTEGPGLTLQMARPLVCTPVWRPGLLFDPSSHS